MLQSEQASPLLWKRANITLGILHSSWIKALLHWVCLQFNHQVPKLRKENLIVILFCRILPFQNESADFQALSSFRKAAEWLTIAWGLSPCPLLCSKVCAKKIIWKRETLLSEWLVISNLCFYNYSKGRNGACSLMHQPGCAKRYPDGEFPSWRSG